MGYGVAVCVTAENECPTALLFLLSECPFFLFHWYDVIFRGGLRVGEKP